MRLTTPTAPVPLCGLVELERLRCAFCTLQRRFSMAWKPAFLHL